MKTRDRLLATVHLPLTTVLLAFFLRVYRLGDQNVWWDEGWSIWLSQKDLAGIALRTAADEHPPLHYWMLHFWNALAGTDAFAGRFLSVAFGVLTVALLYRIGKRVGGAWLGVLAALFLAVARFHIWWSQDIKNYTPSILFAFAAVWFALQLLKTSKVYKTSEVYETSEVSSVLAYACFAALALWTHYLAALVLLALNVYWVIALFKKPGFSRSTIARWIAAQFLTAALFAPWMVLYLQNAAAWSAAPAFDFGLFLRLVATVLPLGVTTNIETYALLTIVLTAIALLGVVSSGQWAVVSGQQSVNSIQYTVNRKQDSPTSRYPLPTDHYQLLFTLIVLLPPILIYLLSLTPVSFFAPKIQARYLLILLPAYAILLALGVAVLRRFSVYLALAAVAVILGASAFVLDDYYAGRRLRDEYTTLANTINAFQQPGDLVLLDTDQEWPTFLYYLRNAPEWLGVPNGAPMNASDADLLARRALARHTSVWVVTLPDALATDPQRLVETRLARDLPRQFEQTFGDKRLALYAAAPRSLVNVPRENFAPQYLQSLNNGGDLQLLGFDLPVQEARAGDTLRVVTYWRAATESQANVVLQIQGKTLVDPQRVGTGERIRVESDFVIPPDAQGTLAINTRTVELARVRVEPRATLSGAGPISHPLNARLGDALYVAGYDLPQTKFRAGESVPLTLYWRAGGPIEKNYTVFAHLLGTAFNNAQGNFLWGQIDRVPRGGAYPTTAWRTGEIVPDAYSIPITASAPPGRYKIEIGMYDPATGERLALDDGGDSLIVAEIELTK